MRRSSRFLVQSAAAAVASTLISANAYGTREYGVLSLGDVVPTRLNDSGQVTGQAQTTMTLFDQAFRTSAYTAFNSATDRIPGPLATIAGKGINNSGWVVGTHTSSGNDLAFKFVGTTFTDLKDVSSPNTQRSSAWDVNNASTPQITGVANRGSGNQAFLYQGTTVTMLGTLGGNESGGFALNDTGQVTGSSLNSGGVTRAFRTAANGASMAALSTLDPGNAASTSVGLDINNAGKVVGVSEFQPFIEDGIGMYDLGSLNPLVDIGVAYGINEADQVVGSSNLDGSGNRAAFLWKSGTGMVNLNDLIDLDCGWVVWEAYDINEPYKVGASGEIVGEGNLGGFMLIPIRRGEWNVNSNGNWGTSGNWSGDIPNKEASVATLGTVITGPKTVTLDTSVTVGELYFNNSNAYTIAPSSSNTLTMNNLDCPAVVGVLTGSHVISAGVFLRSDTIFDIGPNTSVLDVTGNISTYPTDYDSVVKITKKGDGKLIVNRLRTNTVELQAGRIEIRENGGSSAVSRVTLLDISSGTKLDVKDNDIVVDYSSNASSDPMGSWNGTTYTGLQGKVQSGFANGAWTGSGIMTSEANAPLFRTTIGIGEAVNLLSLGSGQTALWGGQTVNEQSVLIKYTYSGDINLDGMVNGDDYSIIDVYSLTPGNTDYMHGDVNYDGTINADDYAIVDSGYLYYRNGGSPLPALRPGQGFSAALAAVPEPSSAAIVLAIAAGGRFLRRFRARLPKDG